MTASTEYEPEVIDGIRISPEMIAAGHKAFHEGYWADDHPVTAVTQAYAAMEKVRRRDHVLSRLFGTMPKLVLGRLIRGGQP